MFDIDNALAIKEQEQVRNFSFRAGCIILILALLGLWTGIDFLKENVFKHYFNPSRHVIVEQDPDTLEIYSWKDSLGNVYTPEDRQVKLFPYGLSCLVLIIMGIAITAHKMVTEHYAALLIINRFHNSAQMAKIFSNTQSQKT